MGATLDKSRDFQTVWGDDSGRAFAQDGQYFNGKGEAIENDFQTAEAAADAAKAKAKPAPKPAAPAPTPADAQTDKQMKS